MINTSLSKAAFANALKVIPGGVNSPVRAFQAVGGDPVFIASGKGSHIVDIDENDYIDFVGSWGPLILGHADPRVVSALCKAAASGTSFGAPTQAETELANCVISFFPSIDKIRFVSSGTEATMSALRLARGYTKKNKVIKFEGCYHGHADAFLVAAGSGALTLGMPNSQGVTQGSVEDTLVARYNDIASVRELVARFKNDLAAIIVEPVAGNMGVVLPANGFLQELRSLASENNCVLIFDEVMTGFRVSKGGAQELYNVKPDITVLGKIVGGGLPLAAFGGRQEIMDCLAPGGLVYQAGTLSGNPLAVACGLATIRSIDSTPGFYLKLETLSNRLCQGLASRARDAGVNVAINRAGSMFTLFFTDVNHVYNFKTAAQSHTARYARFFHAMLNRGIYLAPSQFEALFVSIAHSDKEIDETLEKSSQAFHEMRQESF